MSLEDCRARLPIWELWGRLGLPDAEKVREWGGAPGGVMVLAPFREERTPSCHVEFKEGSGLWKDFGADEGGDEVGLIERAEGLSNEEAIARYHELAGVDRAGRGGGRVQGSGFSAGAPGKRDEKKKPVEATEAEKRLGIEPGKVEPEKKKGPGRPRTKGLGEIVRVYSYLDDRGKVAHETVRFEPKDFRQRRKPVKADDPEKVRDGYVWSLKGAPVFPYRLPELMAFDPAEPVFLVEGEKDVENLERLGGVCATTLPMGAGKWREEFGRWFRGRWVVLVVDDDYAGRKGAAKVAGELMGIADRVGIVEMADLWKNPTVENPDVSDWLEWGWEIGETVEEQRAELWKAAEGADLEEEDPYGEVLVKGMRGVTVAEDLLVRQMMKREGLIFVGDKFWRYRKEWGRWERLQDRSLVPRLVRGILRELPGTAALINHTRVSSIVKLAQTERVFAPEDLNRHPAGWLPVRNGLLDVETGQLFPHRAGYLTTVQIPHNYEPGADCPVWKGWLGERQDEETIRQIQEIAGYLLFTDLNFHSFFFFYGDGGTGKSTCVDVFEKLVGEENRVSIELTELDNPFLRSRMVGKSLYLAKELTQKSFQHIGLIKAMVSGDPVSVDVKFSDGYEFRPKGRFIMESNVQAMTPDSSAGFERRFIQVNFDKKIDRKKMDYSFGKRFDAEMPGILNWALEGYRRLKERGRFEHTERSQKAADDIKLHRAQVETFLGSGLVAEETEVERVKDGPEWVRARVGEIFEIYEEWCDDEAVVPFYKELRTFKRELFSHKPEWKERAKRKQVEGRRDYEIAGVVMVKRWMEV